MEPSFREGNHVLTFNWVRPKVGDVIVFRVSNSFVVKRVRRMSGQNIFVEGDNKKMSSKLGPIKIGQIVGKVIFKY